MRTCVIGVGNELRSDEGIGLMIIDRLQMGEFQGQMDYYSLGPDLFGIGRIAGNYERLFIIDALPPGPEPGKVETVRWETPSKCRLNLLSLHDMDLMMQLGWIRRECVKGVWLIGVETASDAWGIGLSPPMEAVFDNVVLKVGRVIRDKTGYPLFAEAGMKALETNKNPVLVGKGILAKSF